MSRNKDKRRIRSVLRALREGRPARNRTYHRAQNRLAGKRSNGSD